MVSSLIIPEVRLFQIYDSILDYVRIDYANATGNKENSYLHRVFGGVTDGNYNYLNEAIDLFTRPNGHNRKPKVRLFFDSEETSVPTIHITLPGDMTRDNSIGVDEISDRDAFYTNDDGTIARTYAKRFNSDFHLVLTSDNEREVMLMYHLLRAATISFMDSFSTDGLQNLKINGRDLRINTELVPNHIFARNLSITFDYDIRVPKIEKHVVRSIINFNSTINVRD